ncbi:hypothetical protein JOF53_006831 [Crossiella equi]|uniref:Beta propeller domain-containing protein n=1 Tax=Crossiella equi TaxID=130796 RepID=A0ABS5AN02_9PSEU|nr:beta-propeller domain-containing protein [Crossiella equi]MBP2477959.1 hypothetical protein [Crossiella equi]
MRKSGGLGTGWARVGVVAVAAGLVAGGAVVAGGGPGTGAGSPTTGTGSPVRLVSYDNCQAALEGFRAAAAPVVGAYGFAQQRPGIDARTGGVESGDRAVPSTPGSAQQHSTTNRNEASADEPDLVKNDGKRLVSIVDGTLRVIDLATERETGVLRFPADTPATQLLTHGDRALVFTSGPLTAQPRGEQPRNESIPPEPDLRAVGTAKLVLVDLSGPPKILGSLTVEGSTVDARQVGGVARVVLRSIPHLKFTYPDGTRTAEEATRRNQDVVRESTIEDWLPRYELDTAAGRSSGRLADCAKVSHPDRFSGAAMLTVLTLPLDRALGKGDPVTVAGDGNTVYANDRNLYVADDQWQRAVPLRGGAEVAPVPEPSTRIHQFTTTGTAPPVYAASGEVPGALLNQYSLSEHEGHLRVATTIARGGPQPRTTEAPDSRSAITVLSRQGNALREVGKLDGLGKGERIYAVRYLGPKAYVVTFRQTDPLYTLDLANPRAPREVGELKITGYSAYLHDAGGNRLIGVGQEATPEGRTQGTQVSLFDVSTAAAPRRVAQHQVPGAYSEAEFDPHAFLYWQPTGLLLLPLSQGLTPPADGRGTPRPPRGSALALRLTDGAVTELGTLLHPQDRSAGSDATIRRAVIAQDSLWTVSRSGVKRQDLSTLAERAWIAFS